MGKQLDEEHFFGIGKVAEKRTVEPHKDVISLSSNIERYLIWSLKKPSPNCQFKSSTS